MGTVARVLCGALLGVDAFRVDLEVDYTRSGIPAFTMVGLAEGAVKESRERVFAALRGLNFKIPPARVTVNFAPADKKKGGSAYDLPLALALLAASNLLPASCLDNYFIVGELSLNGDIRAIPGVLPLAILAKSLGVKGFIVSSANAAEAAIVEGLPVYGMDNLQDAVDFVSGAKQRSPVSLSCSPDSAYVEDAYEADFADVKGQEHAKRAIEIAAAGGHNLLFLGPPGSGKTMLAKRLPSVLPRLLFDEALEVTKIYSVSGLLAPQQGLIYKRPFRAPHHTISERGLIGGGAYPRPGEISLAHGGVLFLDELLEFRKQTLEVLRQPLEDGKVIISRAAVSLMYPAHFMLVAAMNPCPCGYLSDPMRQCSCTQAQIQRYRSRLSGPLLDRIDLHVEVPSVPYEDLQTKNKGKNSASMRETVEKARKIQKERFKAMPLLSNADLNGRALDTFCALDKAANEFLKDAVISLNLSARAYTRILRIARTIADIAEEECIQISHLAEAVNLRSLDRTQE